MPFTATQMNEVATLLNTNDKNVVINAVLATLVKSGIAIDTATDMVFGEGAYKKLAGEVYRALRGE
jgi:hypothetical protein